MRFLLEAGAAVNGGWFGGRRALYYAASKGHLEVARTLLDGGADPNQRPFSPFWLLFWWVGWTPLMAAAGGGHTQVVELLLQRGAQQDARSYWRGGSQSAASIAVKYGHPGVASYECT